MDRTAAVLGVFVIIGIVLSITAIVWGVVEHGKNKVRGERGDPALSGDVAALRDQMDLLQQQVAETQERLDFAERLLAQGRSDIALPKAR